MKRIASDPSRESAGFVGLVGSVRRMHPAGHFMLLGAGLGVFFLTNVDGGEPAWASSIRHAAVQPAAGLQVLANRMVQNPAEADSLTPAKPFHFSALDQTSRDRAEKCLAEAVYYEAGSESEDGQRAVAQVVLNRVRHAAFPSSVCAVVYQGSMRQTGCQFTFTCDGSLARQPSRSGWQEAMAVARQALDGAVYAPVGFATHYHANWTLPYWASSVAMIGKVGGHIFYGWKGPAGSAGAFTQAYSGLEAPIVRMAVADQPPVVEAALGAEVADGVRPVLSAKDPLTDPENADLLNFRSAGSDRPAARPDEVKVASSIQAALQ